MRHSRETGIFETSTTATPIRDVEMYGSLFLLLCLLMSPFRPFLLKPLVVVVVVLLSLLRLPLSFSLLLSPFLSLSLALYLS